MAKNMYVYEYCLYFDRRVIVAQQHSSLSALLSGNFSTKKNWFRSLLSPSPPDDF